MSEENDHMLTISDYISLKVDQLTENDSTYDDFAKHILKKFIWVTCSDNDKIFYDFIDIITPICYDFFNKHSIRNWDDHHKVCMQYGDWTKLSKKIVIEYNVDMSMIDPEIDKKRIHDEAVSVMYIKQFYKGD